MTTTFQAIEEIDISSLFKPTELQSPEVDVLIANALASDGAFVAMGLPGSNHLDKEMSNLMRFFDLPLEMKLRFATKNYQPSSLPTRLRFWTGNLYLGRFRFLVFSIVNYIGRKRSRLDSKFQKFFFRIDVIFTKKYGMDSERFNKIR